ncbi:phosphoglycerate mutase family protein [Dictyocaulus viviparus]|uniref:Phosphoglycerate mutase family protein n=1 Tax=Dictyocaulus viviparus TaxID=29172 RepID=A0A0D8XFI7_DICVI|nr:phosphoglycerate mutase family protein [Dictyocaulus viviparus]
MKTPSRVLWFVRHGERIDNVDDTWKMTAKRWDDPPLSNRGQQQAREVGIALMADIIDYAICSPFTRCIETATEILSQRKIQLPLWIEPGFGESLNACMVPPGRPSMSQIKKLSEFVDDSYVPVYENLPPEYGGDEGCIPRVAHTLQTILSRYPTGNILFVSHGSPIAACHMTLCRTWYYVGQCTIGKIVMHGNGYKCEYFGDSRHLSDKTNLREIQRDRKSRGKVEE